MPYSYHVMFSRTFLVTTDEPLTQERLNAEWSDLSSDAPVIGDDLELLGEIQDLSGEEY